MPSHEVHRLMGYTQSQLFDLVADVERYPEFLPWWIDAKICQREDEVYYTEQLVGFGPIRERFCSKTVLMRPQRIDVTSSDKPFRQFSLVWQFIALPDNACRVVLKTQIEFRSLILQEIFGRRLAAENRKIIAAFQSRAQKIFQ